MKTKNKIDPKHAKEQVKLLCEFYDLDLAYIPPNSRDGVESILLGLEKGIARGRLEIKGEKDGSTCMPVLHVTKDHIMEFKVLDGAAKVAMSKASTGDNHERIHYLLGYMSGEGSDAIEDLEGKMMSTAETLGMFFLQV